MSFVFVLLLVSSYECDAGSAAFILPTNSFEGSLLNVYNSLPCETPVSFGCKETLVGWSFALYYKQLRQKRLIRVVDNAAYFYFSSR